MNGLRIIRMGLVIGLCGIGPILVYALLGPTDGNPIGLGLLAMLSVPVTGAVLAVGFVKLAIELILGPRS